MVHKFEMKGSNTLSDLINHYGWKTQEFDQQVFKSEPMVVIESDNLYSPLVIFMVHTCLVGELIRTVPVKVRVVFTSAVYNQIAALNTILVKTRLRGFYSLKRYVYQWIKECQPVQKSLHQQREKRKRHAPPTCQVKNSHTNPNNVYFL